MGCCSDTVAQKKAEIDACVEGLRLATEWVRKPIMLESDCADLVATLKATEGDRSLLSFKINEARLSKELPDVNFLAVKREQNSMAHELAQ